MDWKKARRELHKSGVMKRNDGGNGKPVGTPNTGKIRLLGGDTCRRTVKIATDEVQRMKTDPAYAGRGNRLGRFAH